MLEPLVREDEFLADVREARSRAGLHLWWLGQSGFLIQWGGKHMLMDPYLSDSLTRKYAATDKPHVRMTKRVVDPERLDFVDVVTSSHNHTDHLDAETLDAIIGVNAGIELLIPAANQAFVAERLTIDAARLRCVDDGTRQEIAGIEFIGVAAAHETVERDDDGRCRFLGYVVRLGGVIVYHSGDTVLYPGMVEKLKQFKIDVALLPITPTACASA